MQWLSYFLDFIVLSIAQTESPKDASPIQNSSAPVQNVTLQITSKTPPAHCELWAPLGQQQMQPNGQR